MNSFFYTSQLKLLALTPASVLLVSALLVAGCTESRNPDSNVTQLSAESVAINMENDNMSSRTRVDFAITVPAYISNSLQVRLVWGTRKINAEWIGDEYWSATVEYPTNTEQLLTVTFSDNNGAIALGSFEQPYRTGYNATEIYEITADQFDADRWDTDKDGINNLNESIAGTDPLQGESVMLELRDSVWYSGDVFIAETFSRRIPLERPYSLNIKDHDSRECTGNSYCAPWVTKHDVNINFDEVGSGSFSDIRQVWTVPFPSRVIQSADRINSGSSITLEGAWKRYDGHNEVGLGIKFKNEVSAVELNMYSYVGTSQETSGATYVTHTDIEYNLTGRKLKNSTLCEPIAGTIVRNSIRAWDSSPKIRATISKKTDEPYWRVIVEEVVYRSGALNKTLVEEYWARSLRARIYQNSTWTAIEDARRSLVESNFQCEFEDL